jgi:phosphate/sulfate permease
MPLTILAESASLGPFLIAAGVLALLMLIWDAIEVGRNDATNLVNAVFGARILSRKPAVMIAGVAVIIGAAASSPVIETARKGVFDPPALAAENDTPATMIEKAVAVYVSVYIVDTILLYGYSAFGMPVSTTACLVFELLGAALALGGLNAVRWTGASTIVMAIICSILVSGIAGFLIQRVVRSAIREHPQNMAVLLAHGGWVGGAMLTALCYFLIVKGMKNIDTVKVLNRDIFEAYGPALTLLLLWAGFSIMLHFLLLIFGKPLARRFFQGLAVIGMIAMALAFGQNDLANCASPGLGALYLIQHRDAGVVEATQVPISHMMTTYAHRVTSAEVHTGSMAHQVRLWAPKWCIGLARIMLRYRRRAPTLAPLPTLTAAGKVRHYDALRASVILCVSASVIATASSFGLPVSTTYVAFAAVVATGIADRVLQRGDAELKLARTIWVVFSWFSSAVIAAIAAGFVCLLVYKAGVVGMVLGVTTNLIIRHQIKRRSDAQEQRVREETRDRMHPELYAEEYED